MEPETQAAEAAPETNPAPCNDCGGSGLGPDRIDGPGEVFQDPCSACDGTGQEGGRQGPGPDETVDPRLDLDEDPFPAAPAQAPIEPPKYRVIAREAIRLGIPLDVHERATLGDKIGSLATNMRQLERDHEEANVAARAEAKLRREAIQDAQAALDAALEAQTTGIETRTFPGERRAVIATTRVELVRLDTEEVIESREMTEAEQAKWCRQGDILDVTSGATVPVSPTGEATAPEDDTRRTDKGNRCVGWPVAWEGATWPVQVDDETVTLTEPHVWEVYVQTPSDGEPVTAGSIAKLTGYQRQCVVRALDLLKGKGLARQVGKKWLTVIPSAVAEVSAEGGRKDDLPASGDIVRVRLSEPGTKADALLADAGEVAAVYGIPG